VTERMCACCSPRGMAVLLAAALLATGPECLGTAAYAESGKGWAGEFPVITTARSAHSPEQRGGAAFPASAFARCGDLFRSGFRNRTSRYIHSRWHWCIFVDLSCRPRARRPINCSPEPFWNVRGVSAPGSFGPIVGNSQFRLIVVRLFLHIRRASTLPL